MEHNELKQYVFKRQKPVKIGVEPVFEYYEGGLKHKEFFPVLLPFFKLGYIACVIPFRIYYDRANDKWISKQSSFQYVSTFKACSFGLTNLDAMNFSIADPMCHPDLDTNATEGNNIFHE